VRAQPRRDHARIVHHQERAFGKQRGQVDELTVQGGGLVRREQQQARGVAALGGTLRDQLGRQLEVEVGDAHGGPNAGG
jgi:hypothetical protein